MHIYPAIDLKDGSCVRLYKGSFAQVTTYNENPLSVAQGFEAQGAKLLHVVDLDGAKTGKSQHRDIIAEICQKTTLQLQVGGGIRQQQQIAGLLAQGVVRVIVGSMAVQQVDMVKSWFKYFGADKIVLALDVRMNEHGTPLVAAHGWQQDTACNLWDVLDAYQAVNLTHVLCTDINCDGTLQGPNLMLYRQYHERYPHIQLQASGGIGRLKDLQDLMQIPVSSVIIGKALYENKFSLTAALQAAET